MSSSKRPRRDEDDLNVNRVEQALNADVDLKKYAGRARRVLKLKHTLEQHGVPHDEVYAVVEAIQRDELNQKVDLLVDLHSTLESNTQASIEALGDIATAITDQTSCQDQISDQFYRRLA